MYGKSESNCNTYFFYHIDPSNVRYQKGRYGEEFNKHGARFDKFKLQKWQNALKITSNLCGFHSSNFMTEAKLIDEVVECVLRRLKEIREQGKELQERDIIQLKAKLLSGHLTIRSDVYGFGVVLLEMFIGRSFPSQTKL